MSCTRMTQYTLCCAVSHYPISVPSRSEQHPYTLHCRQLCQGIAKLIAIAAASSNAAKFGLCRGSRHAGRSLSQRRCSCRVKGAAGSTARGCRGRCVRCGIRAVQYAGELAVGAHAQSWVPCQRSRFQRRVSHTVCHRSNMPAWHSDSQQGRDSCHHAPSGGQCGAHHASACSQGMHESLISHHKGSKVLLGAIAAGAVTWRIWGHPTPLPAARVYASHVYYVILQHMVFISTFECFWVLPHAAQLASASPAALRRGHAGLTLS